VRVGRIATAALALAIGCARAASNATDAPTGGATSAPTAIASLPFAPTATPQPTPTATGSAVRSTSETALWARLRADLPSGAPVAQPTWLPGDIDREHAQLKDVSATASDPRYTVVYSSARGAITFGLGPGPAVTGSGIGTLVRNATAVLSFDSGLFSDPRGRGERQVRWTESGRVLRIESEIYSGDDLLHIAWSLDRTGAPPPPHPYTRSKIGACANAGGTPEDTVRGYVRLLSSRDVDAIADCFALERWGQFGGLRPELPATSDFLITGRGEVGGRTVLGASWKFASDPGGAWNPQPHMFFTIGLEDGRWRIFETGTAAYGSPP
jgi:hypothetical protein